MEKIEFISLPNEAKNHVALYRKDYLINHINRIYTNDNVVVDLYAMKDPEKLKFTIELPIYWECTNFHDIIRLYFGTREARDEAFKQVLNIFNVEIVNG